MEGFLKQSFQLIYKNEQEKWLGNHTDWKDMGEIDFFLMQLQDFLK